MTSFVAEARRIEGSVTSSRPGHEPPINNLEVSPSEDPHRKKRKHQPRARRRPPSRKISSSCFLVGGGNIDCDLVFGVGRFLIGDREYRRQKWFPRNSPETRKRPRPVRNQERWRPAPPTVPAAAGSAHRPSASASCPWFPCWSTSRGVEFQTNGRPGPRT